MLQTTDFHEILFRKTGMQKLGSRLWLSMASSNTRSRCTYSWKIE